LAASDVDEDRRPLSFQRISQAPEMNRHNSPQEMSAAPL